MGMALDLVASVPACELLILVCRYRDKLVGIAPLFVTDSAGVRTAQIIGCVDVTDYLDFIVDKDYLQPVFEAFADYFARERAAIDCFDLCNIPQESPTRAILPELLRARGFETEVDQQEVCPVIDLPSDWEDICCSWTKSSVTKFGERCGESMGRKARSTGTL